MIKEYACFRYGITNGKINKVYRMARNKFEHTPTEANLHEAEWLEEVHSYIADKNNYRDGVLYATGRMYGLIKQAKAIAYKV